MNPLNTIEQLLGTGTFLVPCEWGTKKPLVTYVDRPLWPAIVRAAEQFDAHRLAAIRKVHTATGKHKLEVAVFPGWVPSEIIREAAKLTVRQAGAMLRVDDPRPDRK